MDFYFIRHRKAPEFPEDFRRSGNILYINARPVSYTKEYRITQLTENEYLARISNDNCAAYLIDPTPEDRTYLKLLGFSVAKVPDYYAPALVETLKYGTGHHPFRTEEKDNEIL